MNEAVLLRACAAIAGAQERQVPKLNSEMHING